PAAEAPAVPSMTGAAAPAPRPADTAPATTAAGRREAAGTVAPPPHGSGPGPDSWAAACEADPAAERARRRERYGPPPLDPVTELRRLADAVTERLGKAGAGLGLDVALLAGQARSALEPVLERNADVLRHLAGAGRELAAAYRAA